MIVWPCRKKAWLGAVYMRKNHPTKMRRLIWVKPPQNGVFHFVKTNRLYETGFIPPRWGLTSTQVRSYLGGMIYFHINSFCRAVSSKQDCSFSLDSVRFCNYYEKKSNSSYKIWQCGCLLVIRNWNKNKRICKQWK